MFENSHLDWAAADLPEARGRRAFMAELLAIRQRRIAPLLEDATGGGAAFTRIGTFGLDVRWTLGEQRRLVLLAQLGPAEGAGFSRPPGESLWVSSPNLTRELASGRLGPWSVAGFLTETPIS